ncbi:MAG: HDOD domain-containing protein [Desulfobacterales bacterium]|jgi:HD-like signal output (HDOD) protein|nr:HDOD domain-containing protein [Deltaproteobacteria bacterium]
MQAQRSLVGIIESHAAKERIRLPAFNATALRIQKEVAKEDPDSRLIERLIVSDQSLTGEVLRVSNSSFYKGLAQVTTIRDALIRLGTKEVSNIVTLVALRHNFESKIPLINQIMKKLWRHSVGCGIGANWIAKETRLQKIAHESFIAGLLHDVGKLYILKVIDGMVASKEIDDPPSDTVINEVMESLHTDQGYSLMQRWNLPENYCLVARDHHLTEIDAHNLLLILVRLANQMCHKMGIGLKDDPSIVLHATPEANQLQLSEVDMARLEVRLEDSHVFAG